MSISLSDPRVKIVMKALKAEGFIIARAEIAMVAVSALDDAGALLPEEG